MTLPSVSIRVGKCYLMDTGKVRRVILHEQGKVVVHEIDQSALKRGWPRRFVVKRDTFAAHAVKEVSCPPDPRSESESKA